VADDGDFWTGPQAPALDDCYRAEPLTCPIRFQGQWEDAETGLYQNRHRYYDVLTGHYTAVDPARFWGGTLQTAYTGQPAIMVDPLGLVPLNDPGWSLYHIVKNVNGRNVVCYVGITSDMTRRTSEHRGSGLIGPGMQMIEDTSVSNVTYATARGAEQADIDAFGTRVLSHRGQDIAEVGTANRANSVDPNRSDERGRAFNQARQNRNRARGCCAGGFVDYLSRTDDCD